MRTPDITSPIRIAVVVGTRPEAIKLMPVLRELARRGPAVAVSIISTSQHTDLLAPLLAALRIDVAHHLAIDRASGSLDQLLGGLLCALDPVLDAIRPDAIVVQGDTTSALAGALAGFHRRLEVVHVEAGMRSGNPASPFPEEVNRRLITTLASRHMAATNRNVAALMAEGVAPDRIQCTGNTVVDAVRLMLEECPPSAELSTLLRRTAGRRLIVLTTHRRENFGDVMVGHLGALGAFVDAHEDVVVVFPVHPNPAVQAAIATAFRMPLRVQFVAPMLYPDFLHLLGASWLIVSDSGGIQEEAVTLGKPIIVLRDTTERPEVLETGLGHLAGHDPGMLASLLNRHYTQLGLPRVQRKGRNPFGDGFASQRIVDSIVQIFGGVTAAPTEKPSHEQAAHHI